MNSYEIVWFNKWETPNAYISLGFFEGKSPEDALRKKLRPLTRKVRHIYGLGDSALDDDIQRTLYALRSDALIPARDLITDDKHSRGSR